METIIAVIVSLGLAYFIARDADKNHMNPWVWGICTFLLNIFSLPLYFIFSWLDNGKSISVQTFEKRRVKILQVSLILAIISVVFVFLSTLEDKNTQEEKKARENLLLMGLAIGIPSAICVVVSFTSKQNELISNQINNISNPVTNKIEGSSFCQTCGKQIVNSNAQFCASCGAKI
jgi:heme/copper-type cytochrome/quinol oxidase subunit 2